MKCKRPLKLRVDLKIHGGMEGGAETDDGGEVCRRRLRLRRGMFQSLYVFEVSNSIRPVYY